MTARTEAEPAPPVDQGPPPLRNVEPMARRLEHAYGSRLDVLPVDLLVYQIFSWLTPPPADDDDVLFSRGLDPWVFNSSLFTVQQVCRAWHWHAKALAARYRACVWLLHEFDVVYQLTKPVPPATAGNVVTELQVALSCVVPPSTRYDDDIALCHTKLFCELDTYLPANYWTSVFSACPGLRRLDLSRVPFLDNPLAAIVNAAATHCPNIQSLLLPTPTTTVQVRRDEETNVLALVAPALPIWKEKNGGLVHLSLPWYTGATSTAKRQFLELIATHCPMIRYLRDWTYHTSFHDKDPRDYQKFCLLNVDDLDTWRFACDAVLPRLEELHWQFPSESITQTDCARYLHTFASTVKPRLRDMYLGYTWRAFQRVNFPALDEATVASFFKATPNLEAFALVAERFRDLQLDLATPHDMIVTQIGKHCPRIKLLRIDIRVPRANEDQVPMVTDVGISEILRMEKTLRKLSLRPIRISSQMATNLVDAVMTRKLHDIEISLWPVHNEVEVVGAVLERLANMETSFCTTRPRFVLRIEQRSSSEYPQESRAQIEAFATRVKQKWRAHGHEVQLTMGDCQQFELLLRWNFPADRGAPHDRFVPTPRQFKRWDVLRPHFERFKELHQVTGNNEEDE